MRAVLETRRKAAEVRVEELEAELARIQAAPAPLTALRAEGSHLAAVTGGKGAVLGFVTTEDVLSELVGPARPAA